MDGLRWLLLLFGVVVIAGVYWYSRRQQRSAGDAPPPGERVEPTLGDDDLAEAEADLSPGAAPSHADSGAEAAEPASVDEASDESAEAAPGGPRKIVTLRLVARSGGAFAGDELILSLRGIGMRHGKFGIYHRIEGEDDEQTIFSAASLVEPGIFDLDHIREQSIPGISLFLVLPGPIDGVDAFEMMVEAARTLAQSLNGELLDESGSTLSIQRERYMREEIVQFTHSSQLAE